MNNTIKGIMQTAMFDNDLLAEKITYNGTEILAIVELGETEKEKSPSLFHQRNTVQMDSDGGITIKEGDVANPKRGDKVIIYGKTYFVASQVLRDSPGGNITLELRADEGGYRIK